MVVSALYASRALVRLCRGSIPQRPLRHPSRILAHVQMNPGTGELPRWWATVAIR